MMKAIFLFDVTGFMALPWAKAGYQCFCFDGQHPKGVSISSLHSNIINVGMWFSNEVTGDISLLDIDKIKSFTGDDVGFVFGFPECTHLAVSGAAHFAKKRDANPFFQDEAMVLVHLTRQLGESCGCSWALENPVSVVSSKWRKPDYTFNPHEYGGYLPWDDVHPAYPEYIKPRDAYPKKTCIWAGNGFVMPEFKMVGPYGADLVDGKSVRKNKMVKRARQRCNIDGPMYDAKGPVMESYERLLYQGYDIDGYPVWGYSDQHKKLGGKSLKTKNIRSATPRGFAQAVFEANNKLNEGKS